MTKFRVEPYRTVSVRTIQPFESATSFFESASLGVPPGAKARIGPFLWANGVVFSFAGYAPSEAVSREYLSGHLPWDNLDFAPMQRFVTEVKLEGRDVGFFLRDVSKHTLFGPLSNWIKSEFYRARPRRR